MVCCFYFSLITFSKWRNCLELWCVENGNISKLHARRRGSELRCDSHSCGVLPAGPIAYFLPADAEGGPAVPAPAQHSGMHSAFLGGCDASGVCLCAGLHLGLRVPIEIRYHIHQHDCLTGVVFTENPSFLGEIFILQVKNVKAF